MELRQNQIKPVQIGIDFFKSEKSAPSIIVAPTAYGKSILIAKIAEGVNDKVLVLQPSKELLEQNYNKYISLGLKAAIYSASFSQKDIGQVTFATIGSIKSIGKRFKELGIKKLIIDECHLFPRAEGMIHNFLKDAEMTHVLGLTATPCKLQQNYAVDGSTFSKLVMLTSRSKKGNFFHDIIYVAQIQEMVKLGFWSKLTYQIYDQDFKLLKLNSTQSDFTEESLKLVHEANNINDKILAALKSNFDRESILVFVPSVEIAQKLAAMTPDSAAVYSGMPDSDRDKIIFKFKAGILRVVYNVNILSVGFDHPSLDCIIMARKMNSFDRYYQIIGRGTRIHPDGKDCLIIDFSGTVNKFGRVEYIIIHKDTIWRIYGEGGRLLTGIDLKEIKPVTEVVTNQNEQKAVTNFVMPFGKYKGTEISKVDRSYLKWMLEKFEWNANNQKLKNEILNVINPS